MKRWSDVNSSNISSIARFFVRTLPGFQGSRITLDFEIEDPQHNTSLRSSGSQDTKPEVSLNIRTNANVTLEQVLNGEAVFVSDNGRSQGSVNINGEKGFYHVQELLNQIVPRKRSVDSYSLIAESGKYGPLTENAVKLFREQFGSASGVNADGERIGNTRVNFTIEPNGNVKYQDTSTTSPPAAPNNDNTTDTFRKLMKDYNHRGSPTQSRNYLHRIIDKETLIGAEKRIPATWLSELFFGIDVQPNDRPANSRQDTGLYELYKNVVVPYIDEMIKEAEYYSGDRGTPGVDAPTDQWFARSGEGPEKHGLGMSYSFGGKMNVEQFNDHVSPTCYAPEEPRVKTFEVAFFNVPEYMVEIARPAVVSGNAPVVDWNYHGNIINNDCDLGNGSYKYPGLKKHEWAARESHPMDGYIDPERGIVMGSSLPTQTIVLPQYAPQHWAGIDCSGLVQRAINKADNLEIPGAHSKLDDLGDGLQCTAGSPGCLPCGSQSYMPDYAHKIVDAEASKPAKDAMERVRKGDLVVYSGHVALVYSDAVTCDKVANCTYEIIHAYGVPTYKYDGRHDEFSRKVTITRQDIGTPTGFGRIKLWD